MMGFNQVYPLWLLASKDSGGLQWTTSKIGKVMVESAGECFALRVVGSVSAPARHCVRSIGRAGRWAPNEFDVLVLKGSSVATPRSPYISSSRPGVRHHAVPCLPPPSYYRCATELAGLCCRVEQVLGWTGVAMMLYQFMVYPLLCRTVGIVWMLRFFGVVSAVLLVVAPDLQHFHWSEQHSYTVGVALLILLDCTMSVVSLFWPCCFGHRRCYPGAVLRTLFVPFESSYTWLIGVCPLEKCSRERLRVQADTIYTRLTYLQGRYD